MCSLVFRKKASNLFVVIESFVLLLRRKCFLMFFMGIVMYLIWVIGMSIIELGCFRYSITRRFYLCWLRYWIVELFFLNFSFLVGKFDFKILILRG